jgi:hypothetical protein
MTRFKQVIVAILLAASMVLTAAEAYAKPPAVCAFLGCSVGPDNCLTINVGVAFVEVSMTCYTRIPTTTN